MPKAFVPLAGRPLLTYAVATAAAAPGVVGVVLVVPDTHLDVTRPDWGGTARASGEGSGRVLLAVPPHAATAGSTVPDTTVPDTPQATMGDQATPDQTPRDRTAPDQRVRDRSMPDQRVRVSLVAGGAERSASVAAGLAALPPCELVLVHDAARCLTPVGVYQRVIAALRDGAQAVVPGMPVVDTIKVVNDDEIVTATPPRGQLRAVQTPQGFTRAALERAHASGKSATDDAALAEACGIPVRVVPGDALAHKVTTPPDLAAAERLVSSRTALIDE